MIKIGFLAALAFFLASCTHTPRPSSSTDPKVQDLSPGQAIEDEVVNIEVQKFTFNNGLRVLLVKNDHLPIFSFYTFYDVGARYESPGITGASHFLEHLMFKGAKKYGPGEFDQIIERNGGSSNAYTSMDETVYYENLPKHALDKIIDLEADRMANLLLEPEAFERERKVILEERKLRYENSPGGLLFQTLMEESFRGTPYGGSVIGSIEDLKKVSRDQIFAYFKQFYAPNNAVIVIVGDIDIKKTHQMLKNSFGHLAASPDLEQIKTPKDQPPLYSFRKTFEGDISKKGNSTTPLFAMAFKGGPLGVHRSYVMDILSAVIGIGDSSYLVQKFVKSQDPQLGNIYAHNYNLKHNGLFLIGGELLQGVSLEKFKKEIFRDLKSICDKAITGRAVQKAKNQFFIGLFKGLQTNAGVAQFIGNYENSFGDYNRFKKDMEIYTSITPEEVMSTCQEVLGKERGLFISVWDQHS